MKYKIAVVTGTRAEYGLLHWVLREIQSNAHMQLQLIATGAHLSKEHGNTLDEITRDGFDPTAVIQILGEGDAPKDIAASMGKAQEEFAKTWEAIQPDMIVVLGDRYETLAAAQAALFFKIPIAHIFGGDLTLGAIDESMRHSITKLSHLHFPTNEASARIIEQLGEDPRHVHVVGNPGLDHLYRTELLDRQALEKKLSIQMKKPTMMITYHPETLSAQSPETSCTELLEALNLWSDKATFIVTRPNADPRNAGIAQMMKDFVSKHPDAHYFPSLGYGGYLSALREADVVIGNSSSGIYEAPAVGTPTVNLGSRQKGRLKAPSVIDAVCEKEAIAEAINKALATNCDPTEHPYATSGHASQRIVQIIEETLENGIESRKLFSTTNPLRNKPITIIAEAGVNHNGSLDMAKQLVDAAVEANADIVKFQTFQANALVSKSAKKAEYQIKHTDADESHHEMIRRLQLAPETHLVIQEYCDSRGIEFLSSPFDVESASFLAKQVQMKRLKIPSGELTNGPMLYQIAQLGLPLILSTGMGNMSEIEAALKVIATGYRHHSGIQFDESKAFSSHLTPEDRDILKHKVVLMHCVTEYPTPDDEMNLKAIQSLTQYFGLDVGLSDHSLGIEAAALASVMGAVMIEKHLTLDRNMPGPDHKASLEPEEFRAMVDSIRRAERMMGDGEKKAMPCELKNISIARKSLTAKSHIGRGEKLDESNLTAKRPGTGLSPMDFWKKSGTVSDREYFEDDLIR